MAFSISELSSKLGQHGVQKGNLFRMTLQLPPGLERLQLPTAMPARDLTFYCRSVELPEMNIDTAEIAHQGFGLNTRRPQGMQFPVLPTVFTVDGDMKIPSLFHRWSQVIVNYDKTGGNQGEVEGALPFEIGYKRDYATTLTVDVFNEYDEDIYTYQFGEAYPVEVGSMEAAWANNDDSLILSVGFTYDTLKVTGSKKGNPARERTIKPDNQEGVEEITNDAVLIGSAVAPVQEEERRLNRANASPFARPRSRGQR
jgi:hypothetical protein